MTGIYHTPDGRVLTSHPAPVIGNNIVFNIVNSYSLGPGSRLDSATEPAAFARKVQNQLPVQILPDDQKGLKVVYNRAQAMGEVPRPKTQATKNARKPKSAKKASKRRSASPAPKENGEVPKKTKEVAKPKVKKSKPPVAKGEPSEGITLKKQNGGKSKSKKGVKKERQRDVKPASIPHSVNRFKGKYETVVPAQFKSKQDSLAAKPADSKADYKTRMEKVKLESMKIRRENYYLLKSGADSEKEQYVDPDTKRKQAEKIKEKQEAEERRKQWRTKLENRRKEMGLDFIPETKPQEVPQKAQKRPKTATGMREKPGKVFTNAKLRLIPKASDKEVSETDKKPMITAEEKERRRKLVEDQYKNARMEEMAKNYQKQETEMRKLEKLRELDENRRIALQEAAKEKAASKKPSKGKSKPDSKAVEEEEEELTVLKLNRWIKEEKGEIVPVTEKMVQNPAAKVKETPKVFAGVQTEEEDQSIEKELRQNRIEKQRETAAKKAEQVRQKQMEELQGVKVGISAEDKEKMQKKAQQIQERLRQIAQRKKSASVKEAAPKMDQDPVMRLTRVTRVVQDSAVNTEAVAAPIPPILAIPILSPMKESAEETPINAAPIKLVEQPKPSLVPGHKLPGVVNLSEHLQRSKVPDKTTQKKAAIEIQRYARGYLARQGVKKLREQYESIDEQLDYYQRAASPVTGPNTVKKGTMFGLGTYTEPKLDKDPYSVVNIFIQKNLELLKENRLFPEEEPIREEIEPPPAKTPEPKRHEKSVIQKPLADSISSSIHEEMESVKGSLRKSLGRPKSEHESSIKEDIIARSDRKNLVESAQKSIPEEIGTSVRKSFRDSVQKSIPEEIEANAQKSIAESAQKSIPEEIGTSVRKSLRDSVQKSIPEEVDATDSNKKSITEPAPEESKSRTGQNPVEAPEQKREEAYEEKLNKESNDMLEKFVEITKEMQTQHKEQITEIIDKLCGYLKDLSKPTIVQLAPSISGPVQAVPVTQPSQKTATISKPEESYEPDFEEESNRFSIKGRSDRNQLSGSIKEEIVAAEKDYEKSTGKVRAGSTAEIPEEVVEGSDAEVSRGNVPTSVRKGTEESIEEVIVPDDAEAGKRSARKNSQEAEVAEEIVEEEEVVVTDDQKDHDSSSLSVPPMNNISESVYEKFKDVLNNSKLDDIIKSRFDSVKARYREKVAALKTEYESHKIPATQYKSRKDEISRWYQSEKKTLKSEKQSQLAKLLQQVVSTIEALDRDKAKVAKMSPAKTVPQNDEKNSIRLESLSEIPDVVKEIEEIKKNLPSVSAEKRRKELLQKRIAAEKLLAEKQHAIDEGVKDKILRVEEEEVEKMYQAAVQVDVKAEIENRAKAALEVLKAKRAKEKPAVSVPQNPTKPVKVEGKEKPEEESVAEEIAKESLRESIKAEIKPTDSIQEDIIGQSMASVAGKQSARSIHESIQESIGEAERSVTNPAKQSQGKPIPEEIPAEKSVSSLAESKSKVSVREKSGVAPAPAGDEYSYSIKFDEESHTEVPSKKPPSESATKKNSEDALSDSQTRLYGSSEDLEAVAGSDSVEWVLTLDPPQVPSENPPTVEKNLPSVQEQHEDDEESKHEGKKEAESEIAEESAKATEEYPEDFEDSSMAGGSKTPRDIKGRTAEPESPYSSVDLSLDAKGAAGTSQNGSGSQFKISLERIVKTAPKADVKENVNEIVEGLIGTIVGSLVEEAKEALKRDKEAEAQKRREEEERKKLEEEEAQRKKLEEEEAQSKKLAEAYEKKRVAELNKKADQMTDDILAELLGTLGSPLFPQRVPETEPAETQPKRHITGIKTLLPYVERYVDEVFATIMKNPDRFVQALSQPLNRDALYILGQIQNEDSDYFRNLEQSPTQPVLPVELYLEIEKSRKIDTVAEKSEGHQHEALLTEWSNIHNKCMFDAINDALDYYRPYGIRGPPLPWSKQTRELTFRNGSVGSIKEILNAVKAKVLVWAQVNAGLLATVGEPAKDAPTEKVKLDQCREEKLEAVLSVEVNEGEAAWVDYEQEETQTVLDTADMILERLVTEAVTAAHQIEKDRDQLKGGY